MFTATKIIVSACIIAFVTGIAKKSPTFGGFIAAFPLITVLSVFWLSFQKQECINLVKFTKGVLLGLPSSIVFLLIIYFGLKYFKNLPMAIILGALTWGGTLLIQYRLLPLWFPILIK